MGEAACCDKSGQMGNTGNVLPLQYDRPNASNEPIKVPKKRNQGMLKSMVTQ